MKLFLQMIAFMLICVGLAEILSMLPKTICCSRTLR